MYVLDFYLSLLSLKRRVIVSLNSSDRAKTKAATIILLELILGYA